MNDLKPKKVTQDIGPDSIIVVESLADFSYEGGVETFAMLFGNEFQCPEKELLEKTEGRTLFGFTIDKKGDYKDVGCFLDTTSSFCPEYERIISKMPKWGPGQQRGEPMEQTFAVIFYYGMNGSLERENKGNKRAREVNFKAFAC